MAISAKELQKEFKRDLDADQAKRLAKLLNKAAQDGEREVEDALDEASKMLSGHGHETIRGPIDSGQGY